MKDFTAHKKIPGIRENHAFVPALIDCRSAEFLESNRLSVNRYKINEKGYHHNFWICYITECALCIDVICSVLLPVPHGHF